MNKSTALALPLAGFCAQAFAAGSVTFAMTTVDASGTGASLGRVVATESPYGVVFTPEMTGMAPGMHGFHLHQNAACGPSEANGQKVAGGAAGGHYDPQKAGKHGEPWGDGHMGDLPPLYVAADGKASQPVLAPRLKMADLAGRSLMVHAGGDNHSDHPAPLGGGGARVACGLAS